MPPEQNDTTQAAVTLERTRISTIMALGTKHRIPEHVTQDLITRGLPLDQARASILDHLAADGDRHQIGHAFGGNGAGGGTLDDPTFRTKAMSDAVTAKLMNKPAEGAAAEYRGMTLIDMAREHLSRGGARDAYRMTVDRVAAAAMQPNPFAAQASVVITQTTSDFPGIMQAGIQHALVERYKAQESPLKQLTSARDVPDFKTHHGIQMSAFGSLDHVNEAGEFKNKTISERGEGVSLTTYGNVINFSRQMLINDALGALSDIVISMGRASATLEAQLLAAAINTNLPLRDNKPWFHADHGNLAAAGSSLNVVSLDAGRVAMRSQKDMDGVTFIDAQPKFLVVPVALQTIAEQFIASTAAATTTQFTAGGDTSISTTADANTFSGKLTPLADPRLTGSAWYLFADPNFSPGLVSVYLNGNREPFTDSQDGWRADGVEFKVRHDYGVGVLDHKLAYKNPGT